MKLLAFGAALILILSPIVRCDNYVEGFYCDFEADLCDWKPENDESWIRTSGLVRPGGPGSYLQIRPDSSAYTKSGTLVSPEIPPVEDTGVCISFRYLIHGDNEDLLSISVRTNNNDAEIWEESGSHGNQWMQGNAWSAQTDHPTHIVIKGELYSPSSILYLDDISIQAGHCRFDSALVTLPPFVPLPWDCDFEGDDLCSWIQDPNDDFDWSIQTGSTSTVGTGPPADHTTQTKAGHYIAIDTSSALLDQKARLNSDVIDEDMPMCLIFWFHMYGAHVGTLNVGYGDVNGIPVGPAIWTKSGEQSYNWLYGHVAITTSASSPRIFIEGIAGNGNQGDISIDDVIIVNDSCPALLYCDFQASDKCGYSTDEEAEMEWTRDRGLSAVSLGPYVDHSTGTADGFYMRVKTGQFPRNGDQGILSSPSYPRPLSGYRCLEFWYIISDDVGDFTVEAVSLDLGLYEVATSTQTFTGPTGSFWRKGSMEVETYQANLFRFTLTVQDTISGAFVAIDDVFAKGEQCAGQLGSCDFEIDTCDWSNTQNWDEIDWLRHSGSTGNEQGSPDYDHTTGTPSGWYMFIDSSLSSFGSRARLESTGIDTGSSAVCFSLWYHMSCNDDSQNTISVSAESASDTFGLWSLTGVMGPEWNNAEMSFIHSVQYRLVIEGTIHVGGASSCDVAIDDLSFYAGACEGGGTPPPPFQCTTGGQVIDSQKICDQHPDCADGSDELECGICTFENSQCGYTSDPSGLFPWIRHGGVVSTTPPPGLLLPITDLVNLNGTYMIVDNTAEPMDGAKYARLASPVVQEVSSECVMEFSYYLSGLDDLMVSYRTSRDEETILYRAATPRTGSWQLAVLSVGRIRNPFQFNFLGKHDLSGSPGVTAVSDVRLLRCEFPDTAETCIGEFSCSNRACVFYENVCDFADDCGDYSDEQMCDPERYTVRCDFETELCSFTHIPSDYPWFHTASVHVPDKQYAPTRDHTTNGAGGYYMLAEAYGSRPGDVARLASPVFLETGIATTCAVRFYLFGNGPDVGTLNIYTRTTNGGALNLVRGFANFAIDSFTFIDEFLVVLNNFQVVIEAKVGAGPNAAIAIDDISFVNCDLSSEPLPIGSTTPGPTTLPPCPNEDDFQCGDGQCVADDQVCDFRTQCVNGMDEIACGNCEFDMDFCGGINFGWRRREAGSDPIYLPTDHVLNPSVPGFYLESSYGVNTLTTPSLGPSGPNCQVDLYFYMSNSSVQLELRVYVVSGPALALFTGIESARRWEKATVVVGEFTYRIQLAFDHLYFFPNGDFVALDGITYNQCEAKLPTTTSVATTTPALTSPTSSAPPTTSGTPPTTRGLPPTTRPTTQPTSSIPELTTRGIPELTTSVIGTTTMKEDDTQPPHTPNTTSNCTFCTSISTALIASLSVVFGLTVLVLVVLSLVFWKKRTSSSFSIDEGVENPSYSKHSDSIHFASQGKNAYE